MLENPVFMRGLVVLQGETGSSCPRDNKPRLFPQPSAPQTPGPGVENPALTGPSGPLREGKTRLLQGAAKAANAGFAVCFSAKPAEYEHEYENVHESENEHENGEDSCRRLPGDKAAVAAAA